MPGGGDEHALGHEHQHVGHEDGEAAAAGEQLRHHVRGRHHAGAGELLLVRGKHWRLPPASPAHNHSAVSDTLSVARSLLRAAALH